MRVSRRVCKLVVEGKQLRQKCSRTRLAVATVAFRHVPWPRVAIKGNAILTVKSNDHHSRAA